MSSKPLKVIVVHHNNQTTLCLNSLQPIPLGGWSTIAHRVNAYPDVVTERDRLREALEVVAKLAESSEPPFGHKAWRDESYEARLTEIAEEAKAALESKEGGE